MGAIFTAIGQLQEGKIAERQGKFAKTVAIRNKMALDRQAKAEESASKIKEGRISRQQKLHMGMMRAAGAKTGGQLAGASMNVLADAAGQFSIDRNLALRTGLLRGQELRERGQIELAKGRWARTLGKKAKQMSYVKATGSILSGASKGEFGKKAKSFATFDWEKGD